MKALADGLAKDCTYPVVEITTEITTKGEIHYKYLSQ